MVVDNLNLTTISRTRILTTMAKTLNLKGVKTSFEPVPTDDYFGKLTGVEYREAGVGKGANDKHDNINCEFTLSETTEGDDEYSGRKVWAKKYLTPEAAWSYKAMMLALGADPESLEGNVDAEEDTKKYIGATVVLKVSCNTGDNGKDYNRVEDILSPTDFS